MFFPRQQVADADYLLQRAEEEARLAGRIPGDPAVEAHHRLASAYLDRLFGGEAPPSSARARSVAERLDTWREAFQPLAARLEQDATALTDEMAGLLSRLDD